MAEISFNEEELAPHTAAPTRPSFMTYLVSWGVAKDERQASIILVAVSVLLIAAALFLAFSGGQPRLQPPTAPPTSSIINPAIIR